MKRNDRRRRSGVSAAVLTIVAAVLMSILQMSPASAGPGSCTSGDTGCTAWNGGLSPLKYSNYDGYKFATSDSNLTNNYYVNEACGGIFPPCIPALSVADTIGWYRLNSVAYVRMCRYATVGYLDAIGWIEVHGSWITASTPTGKSLRYWTANQC